MTTLKNREPDLVEAMITERNKIRLFRVQCDSFEATHGPGGREERWQKLYACGQNTPSTPRAPQRKTGNTHLAPTKQTKLARMPAWPHG